MKRKRKKIRGKWMAAVLAVTLVFTSNVSAWNDLSAWATEPDDENTLANQEEQEGAEEQEAAYVLTGTEGENGWYCSEVTVSNREEDSQDYRFAASEEELEKGNGKKKLVLKNEGENIFYILTTEGEIVQGETVKIDTESPNAIKTSQSPDHVKNGTKVTYTIESVSDTSSGLAEKPYRYDDSEEWTADNTYTYTYDADEKKGFSFQVKDTAGNITKGYLEDAKGVDIVAPEISVTANTTDPTKEDVVCTIDVSDEGSGIAKVVYLEETDGKQTETEIEADDGVYKKTVSENGTYQFAVEDQAGNTNEASIEVSNIDKVAPVITQVKYDESARFLNAILGLGDNVYFSKQSVKVYVKATDAESGMDTVVLQVKNGDGTETAYTPISQDESLYTFVVPENALADGQEFCNQIQIITKDKAGNSTVYPEADGKTDAIVVETTKPVVTVSYDNNDAANDKYFAKERTAKITVTEKYFQGSELDLSGITVENSNVDEKTDDAILTALTNQLSEKQNWEHVEGTDDYTIELTFAEDATYAFDLIVTDPAGNSNTDNANNSIIAYAEGTKASTAFVIDTTAPTVTVSYDNNDVVNDKYFAKARVATITVTERYFTDSALDLDGITVKNSNADAKTDAQITTELKEQLAKANWKQKEGTDTYTTTLTFDTDATYSFDLIITDLAGNSNVDDAGSKITYGKGTKAATAFTIDTIAPTVSVSYDNNAVANDKQFAKARVATITVTEHNFADSVLDLDGITVENSNADGKIDAQIAADLKVQLAKANWEQEEGTDRYTATLTFDADAAYTFDLLVTDLAGNSNTDASGSRITYDKETKAATAFVIDTTAPTVTVSYDNNDVVNDKYFAKARVATITVTERYFTDSALDLDGITVKNSAADETTNDAILAALTNQLSEKQNWEHVEGTDDYTIKLTFADDATYAFDLIVTDLAGNSNTDDASNSIIAYAEGTEAATAFVVDQTAPDFGEVTYNQITTVLETLFGVKGWFGFANAPVVVTVPVTDALSGVERVTITVGENTYVSTNCTESGQYLFTLPKDVLGDDTDFNEVVQIIATDKAANTKEYERADGETETLIVENNKPIVSVTYDNNNAKNDHYFAKDRTATITVTERYFADSTLNLDGITVENSNATGKTDADILNDIKKQLEKENWKQVGKTNAYTVTVKFTEDGAYTFDLVVTDPAGNSNTETTGAHIIQYAENTKAGDAFIIDKTAPKVTVSYDNNAVTNDTYFAMERTATIKVTERYFQEDALELNLDGITTANNNAEGQTDAAITEALKAQLAKAQWKATGKTDEYEATLEFTEGAEYTFGLVVTDPAGNSNSTIYYDKTTKAGDTFVIDKTIPTVSVSYDNNNAENDKYFAKGRTATITVVDRYFSASKFDLRGITVQNNNVAGKTDQEIETALKEQLAADKWSTTGETDTYTVTVKFTEDAEYTFDFICKNAAGMSNEGSDGKGIIEYGDSVAGDAFIIDKTNPVIQLTDNDTAKNGNFYATKKSITITIKERYFTDAQLDLDSIKVENNNAAGKTNEEIAADIKKQLSLAKWSKDGDSYKAVVTFTEDGEYTFAIGCTDPAGNTAKLEESQYVIDKTAPVVTVSYNNNSVKNGKYFAKERTATITVTERYFTKSTLTLDGITTSNNNATGKTNAAITKALKAQLAKAEWEHIAGTDDYTTTVTFTEDAEYTFGIQCTDQAGNANVDAHGTSVVKYAAGTQAPTMFVVDKTAPVVQVSYNNNRVESDTYFAKGRTATITVTERYFTEGSLKLSGITVKNNNASNKTNKEIAKALKAQLAKANWKHTAGTDVYTATLTFTEDAEYTFDLICADTAGNCNADSQGTSVITYVQGTQAPTAFIIDKTAPVVEVSYDNNVVQNKKYFSSKRTATITVTERYFKEGEMDLSGITVKKNNVDGVTNQEILDELTEQLASVQWNRKSGTDQYVAKITFRKDADYTFDFVCTDPAGNANTDSKGKSKITYAEGTQAASRFIIDKTAPVVTVIYDNNDAVNGKYFVDTRNAYIEIVDHNFSKNGVTISVSAYADAKYETPLAGWEAPTVKFEKVKGEKDTYAAEVAFDEDINAFYQFSVSFTDLAGNEGTTKYKDVENKKAAAPTAFCIDTVAPSGTIYLSKNKTTSVADANVIAQYKNKLRDSQYGIYQANPIYVLFEEADALSGIDNANVQYYVSTKVLTADKLDRVKWKNTVREDKTQVIPKIETGRDVIIYLKVTDKAGNYTYINTNRIVVDGKNPEDTLSPEVTVNPEQPINGFYNGDVKVAVSVVDPSQKDNENNSVYSGLREVSFQVVGEGELKDENAYAQHVLFTGKKTKPQQSYSTTITVQATHDATLWVRAVDQAGRITEQSCELKIDTTVPQVSIAYDNNSADSSDLFKANRTATITVRERNFAKQQFTIQITKNGAAYRPTLQWQASGSGDDTLYRATIVFSEDGDYVISGITCTDDAGNNTTSYTQAQGTVAGKNFTIDKTKPVIGQVTFDNNAVLNGKYYKADRTATITIVEHNFDASRAQVVVSASGDATTTPKVSGFTTNGDTHTATVSFTQDGVYRITVEVTDGAGNKAESYKTEEFVVDKTIGKATITGVKNQSANRDKDIPITVSFTDTNVDHVAFTLTGDKAGKIQTDWNETAITNGYTYDLDYFTEGGGKDDMYTLTVTSKDKAGNQTKQSITFSINRDGSIYTFSDDTKAVLGSIVKEVPDITIIETNVDQIDSKNVAITATIEGGDSLHLENGKDFTITENEEGQWKQYTYTIHKDNFTGEGTYVLEVMSKDDTGRTNQSSNQEKITFTVDQNGPMLVVKDIKADTVYNEDNHTIRISVNDMSFESLTVHADNLDVTYTSEAVEQNDGEIEVVIPGNTKAQTISISAVDAAGNETVQEIENVLITTNVWARFVNNTWLVVAGILALVIIIAGIIFIIMKKRKKKEDI